MTIWIVFEGPRPVWAGDAADEAAAVAAAVRDMGRRPRRREALRAAPSAETSTVFGALVRALLEGPGVPWSVRVERWPADLWRPRGFRIEANVLAVAERGVLALGLPTRFLPVTTRPDVPASRSWDDAKARAGLICSGRVAGPVRVAAAILAVRCGPRERDGVLVPVELTDREAEYVVSRLARQAA